ncbi:3-dehydroquinate dehydratase [Intrasporangium oryzae NRRL B-24470]|uniref:3-dehydroquinate dehydratase n=1 Tax=Intrasporangium oryzae NRRL B-24470 TaxID=1386089 RepID=W9G932_9MICO|nr:type II 3-dehydroquinate dehydratase [Intrasporangium oryzae]EWT02701.1 3-dehydroquinate dehydratase [Intrasporangium oryzae NRRL B-24470]
MTPNAPVVAVLNGPNLNLLGERQPEVYGRETLDDVRQLCLRTARDAGLELDFRQSNHEGEIVDAIHELRHAVAGVVINAAAYTHTSVAIRDAIAVVDAPVIEVHITNVHRREAFRGHSYLSDVVEGVIVGCGTQGYALAIARIGHLSAARPGTSSP